MHALSVVIDAALAEAVSDALVDADGALSVAVEDADAGTPDESPVFDEPGADAVGAWRRARITALFGDEASARASRAVVEAIGRIESGRIERIDDRDWVRVVQSQFQPVEVAPGFWIVPSWSDVPASARQVIRLDPGLAFGTGTHPTTRMCLSWLAAHRGSGRGADAWPRVLDYGCGSGILAIAAKRLGAHEVDAVDIDPAAIDAAGANATANAVDVRVGPVESARGRYSLVVANILATPLELLAPALAAHVGDGGELVLSGILERQADALRAAYAPWLRLEVEDVDEGWVLLAGRRQADPR